MEYFKQEISSSGKPYYRNNLTNETQWGFKTYYNKTKRLPKGWVRLNLDGKPIYKFNEKVLNSSYSSYAPEDILLMPYQELLDQNDVNTDDESGRRNNLFEQVALHLRVTPDSICDESLEFLCNGKDITVQQIISFIEETEFKQLGNLIELSAFSRIRNNDRNFSSQRSIRELCGLNMRLEKSGRVLNQIEEQFSCSLTSEMFKDPVICNSGHTFEREEIMRWLQRSNKCPNTNIIINFLAPNYALRNAIESFVEKYKNQKGNHWASIVQSCLEYERYPNRLQTPIHIETLDSALVGVGFGASAPIDSALVGVGFGAAPIESALVGVGFGAAAPIERPIERPIDRPMQEAIRQEGRTVEDIRREREALKMARRQEELDDRFRRSAAILRSEIRR